MQNTSPEGQVDLVVGRLAALGFKPDAAGAHRQTWPLASSPAQIMPSVMPGISPSMPMQMPDLSADGFPRTPQQSVTIVPPTADPSNMSGRNSSPGSQGREMAKQRRDRSLSFFGFRKDKKAMADDDMGDQGKEEQSHPGWIPLAQLIDSADDRLGSEAMGAAAMHTHAARREAAKKLIMNHDNVLNDVCNPSESLNIEGKELTQLDLVRVKPHLRDYADQAMRECARRLLGTRAGGHALEAHLDPKNFAQVQGWVGTCLYLDGRIQGSMSDKPGRTPDMSPNAAAAMRAVLAEMQTENVKQTCAKSGPWWQALHELLDMGSGGFDVGATGAAALHQAKDREAAARKLISNHHLVLKDLCNPTRYDVLLGNPVTQLELNRVPPELVSYADECLRECARRLLGARPGIEQLEVRLDPTNGRQMTAWIAATAYLDGRLHSRQDEKPGRTPDMSEAAAEAMRAVLKELSGSALMGGGMIPNGSDRWAALKNLLERGGYLDTAADGVAAQYSHCAREEAAKRLIMNHDNVLKDVTNPTNRAITDSMSRSAPLTQLELTRVSYEHRDHVDAFLREVSRRLLGRRPGIHLLAEKVDPSDADQCRSWRLAGVYLDGRIQSNPDEKPGRTPDMSPLAAAAMRAVMKEVGVACVAATKRECAPIWAALHKLAETKCGPFGSEAEGLASTHSHNAREEAAKKLIMNHDNVLKDVTNPSEHLNIDNIPLTQLELSRVPPEYTLYVDEALREVVRRLLGKRPGSAELEIRIDPKNGKQVAAWAQAAVYLDGRIHAHPDEKPGRTPDMSPPAAAAMRAVLKEVAFAGVHATLARSAPHWAALHQLAVMDMSGSFKKEKDCAAISHSHAAREEAALRLISNRMLVLKDVVNPTLTDATHFVPLTQLELKRCPIEHVIAADQFMREVSRRLLSYKPCTDQFEEMPAGPLEAPAWTMAAAYLDDRIQATPEEKPGRPPDLSIPAAAAMRAVLREVGGLNEPSNNRVKENSSLFGRLLGNRRSSKSGDMEGAIARATGGSPTTGGKKEGLSRSLSRNLSQSFAFPRQSHE